MAYVDGFVMVVPKKKVRAYVAMARKAARIFRELGAVEYRECVGEDLDAKMGVPYRKLTKARATETVFFSWIAYKSRAHRDRVNAKIMKDPRMLAMCGTGEMPFDVNRMAYGGFEVVVRA